MESGIPPFRGPGGLWSQYDPRMLELDYFLAMIRKIFYDHFGTAKPNRAHEVLAAWEARGLLKCLTIQNRAQTTRAPKMFCAISFYFIGTTSTFIRSLTS